MKRSRRWILGCGLAALAAGAAALPLLPASRRRMVQGVVYRYVPGIIFDGDDLTNFAGYIRRRVLSRKSKGLRGLEYYGATFLLYHSAMTAELMGPSAFVSDIDQSILDAFFLCTDFWDGPYQAGRRISMVRPPDPYEAGCLNPLAVTSLPLSADKPG